MLRGFRWIVNFFRDWIAFFASLATVTPEEIDRNTARFIQEITEGGYTAVTVQWVSIPENLPDSYAPVDTVAVRAFWRERFEILITATAIGEGLPPVTLSWPITEVEPIIRGWNIPLTDSLTASLARTTCQAADTLIPKLPRSIEVELADNAGKPLLAATG